MTDVLLLQAHINAPTAKVYEALTTSSALCTWLAEYEEVSPTDDRFAFWGADKSLRLQSKLKIARSAA